MVNPAPMKTTPYLRTCAAISACILTSMTAIGSNPECVANDETSAVQERIGVYDSRAVAVAYVGSPILGEKMKGLKTKLAKAKDAGDAQEVSRIEAEGPAWQATLHQQGFGTAPVDDLLGLIAKDLPKIQKEAGVTILISKWNAAELEKHPRAEQVDVTMTLVDAFHPNPAQRKTAIEIQKLPPQKVKP